MSEDLPDNVFDATAMTYVKLKGIPIADARDIVILRSLEAGDLSAFSHWVLNGHQPGKLVMRTLAYMAQHEGIPIAIADATPFRLNTTRRKQGVAGRREDIKNDFRDELLALNVYALIEQHGNYESAVTEVAAIVSDGKSSNDQKPLRYETVRKAYDARAQSLLSLYGK